MTHTLICPHSARHDGLGHLEIGGCDVADLAATVDTHRFLQRPRHGD